MIVPLAADPQERSIAMSVCRACMLNWLFPRPTNLNCWFAPPPYAHCCNRAFGAVLAPAMSSPLLLLTLMIRKYPFEVGARWNFWALVPLQSHCCTLAPFAVLDEETSMHLPVRAERMTYSPSVIEDTTAAFSVWSLSSWSLSSPATMHPLRSALSPTSSKGKQA